MRRLAALAAITMLACSGGAPRPFALDTANEPCASCRMVVSDARMAAQLVAPGEEPRFFDDLGCLARYLKERGAPRGAAAFVADHRTREWVPAATAVYTRVPALATPMGSHLVAHRDAASRTADGDTAGGSLLDAAAVFGPAGPPAGAP